MIEWTVMIAAFFAMLGAGLRMQVVMREHAAGFEGRTDMTLVWAGKASARAIKPRRDHATRDLVDMKAGGALLGLIGGFVTFVLAVVAITF